MRRLVMAGIAGALLTGCSMQKSVYWPNVAHAPLLKERGDAHVSAHGTIVEWQGNVAYAVLPHVALRAQANAHPGVLLAGDVGVGVFGSLGELRFEAASDVGTGNGNAFTAGTTINEDEETRTWRKTQYDTNFDRVSVQGSVGAVKESVSFAFVLRATRVTGGIKETAQRKDTGESLEKRTRTYDVEWAAIEPVFIVRPRFRDRKRLYGELQFGASLKNGRYVEDFSNEGLLWPLIVVAGIGANF